MNIDYHEHYDKSRVILFMKQTFYELKFRNIAEFESNSFPYSTPLRNAIALPMMRIWESSSPTNTNGS